MFTISNFLVMAALNCCKSREFFSKNIMFKNPRDSKNFVISSLENHAYYIN